MKKALFILACAAATLSMGAQQNVVKDAEKAMKSGKGYDEVLQIILPAMSDAATANEAITYYIPGKAGFKQYDTMLGLKSFGKLPADSEPEMYRVLLGGYENYMKALPLDSVADAKGKIKTKYSKEIVNEIAGHYRDFANAGIQSYNSQNYADGLKAFDAFIEISESPEMKKVIKVENDSVVGIYTYYAALCAYSIDDKATASKLFKSATELTPDNKDAWKNGLITALNVQDPELLMYFAEGGTERFGKEDPDFTGMLINYYIEQKDYDAAYQALDRAIENDPSNAQYYALKGAIAEEQKDFDTAMNWYKKAIEVEPTNGLANFQYGRGIYRIADDMSNNFDNNGDYNTFNQNELQPRYLEAIKYLENAYQYDPNNKGKALVLLNQLYYLTNNEEGMESVKQRQLED